jgi:hypothetical protein
VKEILGKKLKIDENIDLEGLINLLRWVGE